MPPSHRSAATRGGFTPARIVALILIAASAAGLLAVRAGRDADRVSVPAHARAGQLTLEPCTSNGRAADCGTLVVPENRRDADSRLIALPVTRIHARSAHPAEPVFRLEGGPGLSNMEFDFADRVGPDHDVVLVGYRGVDGSSRLDCPEVSAQMKQPRDLLGSAYQRGVRTAFRDCAARLHSDGVDLAGYTLPQRVDDLEDARRALGYGTIDLLSESAGTRTAMLYSWRHPSSIHRSVMVAVNPPGHFLWHGATTDEQIHHYAQLCAQAADCRSRTRDLAATMRTEARDLPGRWGFLPIHEGNARLAAFFGLMESTNAAGGFSAPSTFDAWLSAADGDASGIWLGSFLANVIFPKAQVWGDVGAASRADEAAARRYFDAGGDHGSILGNPGTEFLFGGGGLVDAWPGNPDDNAYSEVRDSDTETLLIGGSVDFATPPGNATRELLPHLRNGHQVVLSELGHTTDFWHYEPAASTRLISTFLDSGRVDESLYRHRTMSFAPGSRQTSMARLLLGLMLGLPLLGILALAGIAWRVRRRGRLGRPAGVAVRTLLAPVLGLAGWLLAVLVVLTTSVTVPIDEPALVLAAVGAPVALGVYAGWVDRRAPRRTRRTALGAAVAAAVLGAGLGLAAGTGLLALLTASAGAVAAANLALIALDVARGGARGDATAEPQRPAVPVPA